MSEEYVRTRSTKSMIRDALSDQDGWLLGVCAGIANWLRIDAAIVRIVTVLCVLFAPVLTIAAYLITWLIFFRKRG